MALSFKKVRAFLSSKASTSTDDATENRKERERWPFSKAAKRQFDEMQADQKKIFKRKHPEFPVDLDQEQSESVVRSSERCPSSGRPSESVSTVNSRKTCEKVSKFTSRDDEGYDEDADKFSTPVVALRYSESLDTLVSVHEESESDDRSSYQEPATELVSAPEPAASQVRTESHSSLYLSPEEKDVVSALLLKVMAKFFSKSRVLVTTEQLQIILKQLLILLDERYLSPDFITKITQETDKITKAMVKDLDRMFGSTEKLLEAATTAKDESFKDTVWMALQVNLEAIPRPDNLKSGDTRFFSSVGRGFSENFRRLKKSLAGSNTVAIILVILFCISVLPL
ncbi:uncharacterized protein LOC129350589 [Amphiprion ocellaris]|uniref:uncharacterized protein LOC129350589 n=1 Tax=Amphiprion ocellaris TaxID=80972 RepID=UPI002410B972|nr:uncharacterized protein LOC129350589 [Amphiprion ocellaris]